MNLGKHTHDSNRKWNDVFKHLCSCYVLFIGRPNGYDSNVLLVCVPGSKRRKVSSAPPTWVSSPLNHVLHAHADLSWWSVCDSGLWTIHTAIKEIRKQGVSLRGSPTAHGLFGQRLARVLNALKEAERTGSVLIWKQGFVSQHWPTVCITETSYRDVFNRVICLYLYAHADLWAYLLCWIQFYSASVKVS